MSEKKFGDYINYYSKIFWGIIYYFRGAKYM